MTQEERDIVYKDACCRLPYRPYAAYTLANGTTVQVQLTGVDEMAEYYGYISDTWGHIPSLDIKLYLRPMSSMTEDEKREYYIIYDSSLADGTLYKVINWLNLHHIDYRRLIEKGLALPASEGMYK